MKRLLIATDSFLPRWDGISRFLSEIIPILVKRFEVTVVAPRFQGSQPVIKGASIITIPTFGFHIGDYNPPRFDGKKIESLVRDADIVWTHTIGPIGMTALNLAKRLSKKSVCYVHSLEWELVPKSLPPTPLIRFSSSLIVKRIAVNLYNKASVIMVPSQEVSKVMAGYGILPRKIVAPIGVKVNDFVQPKSKRHARLSLGLVPDCFVVGFCGRIAREKDLPTLCNAFVRVHRRFPDTMLLIVGGGLKKLHSRFANRNVFFIGSTDNVLPYLQSMDVYVLPSLTETSSLSTMEAMSCGIPVIVTPVGSMKHYVKEGYNGFFFAKHDSAALAGKIEELLLDPDLRRAMGKYARETIIKEFRWEKTIHEITRILLDL
jgi:glycosyltransferase involved in cell wall biosynthesis